MGPAIGYSLWMRASPPRPPVRRRGRPSWFGLLALLWLAGLCACRTADPDPPDRYLSTADLLLRDRSEPPSPEDPAWHRVTLPHALFDDDRRATGAWFRFQLPEPSTVENQALYVYWLNENAALYFNGSFLTDGGQLRDPIARHWNMPLFVRLPAALWRPTGNQILIYLRCDPGWGLLSPIQVGEATALRTMYEWRRFLQVDLARGLCIALLLAASLSLSLWWRRRQDVQYLWFGLACVSWSLFSLYQGLHSLPCAPSLIRWIAHFALDAWSMFFLLFALRQLDLHSARLQTAMLAFVGIAGVLGAPHGLYWQGLAFLLTHTLGMLWVGGCAIWMRAPLRRSRLLLLCFLTLLLASLHDLVFALPWRYLPSFLHGVQLKYRFFAAHYAAPLVLLLLTRNIAQRFVHSLTATETLNRELESRVAASTQALQESYARRAQMEREGAAHAERERIYRDLHDDIGAMLLSLAIRAKEAQDADLARTALRSLRDVVSHSGQSAIPLADLLADWRAEAGGRLGDAGLQLLWEQPESLPSVAVSAVAALNLGRILREAISNIVRHAGASRVEVAIAFADAQLRITLTDDGKLPPGPTGRGMRNMQSRAASLRGSITWTFSPTGCQVCLTLPESALTSASLAGVPRHAT